MRQVNKRCCAVKDCLMVDGEDEINWFCRICEWLRLN